MNVSETGRQASPAPVQPLRPAEPIRFAKPEAKEPEPVETAVPVKASGPKYRGRIVDADV